MTNGPALLRNTQVAARCSACGISCEMSLISGCRIIAVLREVVCADIGDYVNFKSGDVVIADSDGVDTTLIDEVRKGKEVSVLS